eukprot:Opistho-1_new@104748
MARHAARQPKKTRHARRIHAQICKVKVLCPIDPHVARQQLRRRRAGNSRERPTVRVLAVLVKHATRGVVGKAERGPRGSCRIAVVAPEKRLGLWPRLLLQKQRGHASGRAPLGVRQGEQPRVQANARPNARVKQRRLHRCASTERMAKDADTGEVQTALEPTGNAARVTCAAVERSDLVDDIGHVRRANLEVVCAQAPEVGERRAGRRSGLEAGDGTVLEDGHLRVVRVVHGDNDIAMGRKCFAEDGVLCDESAVAVREDKHGERGTRGCRRDALPRVARSEAKVVENEAGHAERPRQLRSLNRQLLEVRRNRSRGVHHSVRGVPNLHNKHATAAGLAVLPLGPRVVDPVVGGSSDAVLSLRNRQHDDRHDVREQRREGVQRAADNGERDGDISLGVDELKRDDELEDERRIPGEKLPAEQPRRANHADGRGKPEHGKHPAVLDGQLALGDADIVENGPREKESALKGHVVVERPLGEGRNVLDGRK